jgi:aconitase A
MKMDIIIELFWMVNNKQLYVKAAIEQLGDGAEKLANDDTLEISNMSAKTLECIRDL